MRPLNSLLGTSEKTWIRRLALATAGVLFAAMQLQAQEQTASYDGPALKSAITKKWTMVIRPGALDQNRNVVAPQLVEFEFDPADHRLVTAPQTFAIDETSGHGVAISPVELSGNAEIAPSQSVPPCPQPCPNSCCTNGSGKTVSPADALTMAKLYDRMYDLIGFSRAEYLANPSYRNEAVIQIMLGQPIPKTTNNTTINTSSGFGGWGGIDGHLGFPGWNFPVSTQSGTFLFPYHSPYYLWQNYPHSLNRTVYSPWLSRYPFGNPGRYYY